MAKGATRKKGVQNTGATVVHAQEGDNNLFFVDSLRVLITEDGGQWCAQALEIDYASCGESIEEAQHQFEKGLANTAREHLRLFGTLKHMLKVAPSKVWEEFLECSSCYEFSMASEFALDGEIIEDGAGTKFPFSRLTYLKHKEPVQAA